MIAGFPNPVLTKILGRRTFAQIKESTKNLRLMQLLFQLHLAVTLLVTWAYFSVTLSTIYITLFAHPSNPGLNAQVPQGATAVQNRFLVQSHQALQITYDACFNVETALKQQLINALDNTYIGALTNEHTG